MHLNLFLDECIIKFISRFMTFFKKNSLVAGVLLVAQLAQSQETISVSVGAVHKSSGSASYTVSHIFYSTNTSTTGAVSQGVQLPFEFHTLSNPGLTSLYLTAVSDPNLTKDCLTLKITDTAINNLRYTFFDVNGKAIASGSITESSTQIQMKHLYKSAYA
jgi:hypothetical protein